MPEFILKKSAAVCFCEPETITLFNCFDEIAAYMVIDSGFSGFIQDTRAFLYDAVGNLIYKGSFENVSNYCAAHGLYE